MIRIEDNEGYKHVLFLNITLTDHRSKVNHFKPHQKHSQRGNNSTLQHTILTS